MKIVKKGWIPVYQGGTCKRCGCVVEIDENDQIIELNVNGFVGCPTSGCGALIQLVKLISSPILDTEVKVTQTNMPKRYWVKYLESERGWGQDVWYTGFGSEVEARAAVKECNSKNISREVPDCYIVAEYFGYSVVKPN